MFFKIHRMASSPASFRLDAASEEVKRIKLLKLGIDTNNEREGVRQRRKPKRYSASDYDKKH